MKRRPRARQEEGNGSVSAQGSGSRYSAKGSGIDGTGIVFRQNQGGDLQFHSKMLERNEK